MRRDAVFDKLCPCWTQPALEPIGFDFDVRVLGLLVVPDQVYPELREFLDPPALQVPWQG